MVDILLTSVASGVILPNPVEPSEKIYSSCLCKYIDFSVLRRDMSVLSLLSDPAEAVLNLGGLRFWKA